MDDDWWQYEFFVELREEHQLWLDNFNEQYRRNWDKLFQNDCEAALFEARVRRLLQKNGATVEPNEDLTGESQRPDFRCSSNGTEFYVESTCITASTMASATGLPVCPGIKKTPYAVSSPTAVFKAKCTKKAKQCSNLDLPAIVAIGTFHTSASRRFFRKERLLELLTGELSIAWAIDLETGTAGDACYTTQLRSAAFLQPDEASEIAFVRRSISGLLLCGVGVEPPQVLGVLHPDAARPFSAGALPNIEFASVFYEPSTSRLLVQW